MNEPAQAELRAHARSLVPRAIAIAVLLLVSGVLVFFSAHATGGRFLYPLDDTYITMSIAKSFSQSGVWGVTRHEFNSSSSTPLYVLLLAACDRVTGPNEGWPLLLALVSGVLALIAADAWLTALPRWLRVFGLLSVAFLVPLYILILTGMEHCLHICLSLIFLRRAATALETGASARALLLLAPVMVLVRFESLFLIGICAGLFLIRKRWQFGAGLLFAAAAPLAAYAAVSLAHGWAWLPNTLLLKGSIGFGRGAYGILLALGLRALLTLATRAPHLLALVLSLAAAFAATRKAAPVWDRRRIATVITLLAILAHLQYARIGWVYRYEGYLIAIAICSLFAAIPLLRFREGPPMLFLAACELALVFLAARTWSATADIRRASFNIYEQQYQMARFVNRYYPEAAIAANDIGWISYASDIRLFDLTGLANWDVFQAKRAGRYTTAIIDREARRRGVAIAIVYDSWFSNTSTADFGGPPLPADWVRAARWRVVDNLFLGDSTVSFYAVRPSEIEALRTALESYAPSLPPSVTVLQN